MLGGNGELGSYLCPKLVELGYEVVAVCDTDLPPYARSTPEWHKVALARIIYRRPSPYLSISACFWGGALSLTRA